MSDLTELLQKEIDREAREGRFGPSLYITLFKKALKEIKRLQKERDDLARALFQVRSLTIRGRGSQQIAEITCKAVLHIDETPLFEVVEGE